MTKTLVLAFSAAAGFVAVLVAVFMLWSAARLAPVEQEVISLFNGTAVQAIGQTDAGRGQQPGVVAGPNEPGAAEASFAPAGAGR